MAVNWDLYNTRLNINGTTKRERDLYCLQNKITNNLPNSLSCKTVKINGIDGSLNFTETEKGYDIQSLPNETFSVGDYVEYTTLTYLVTKVNGDKEVYTSGSMELCNYTLKFQSPTGTILSYPCITSAKSFNEDSTKVITLPSNQKSILCGKNADTLLLKTGRRLYIDTRNESTYKLLDPDTTAYNYGDKGLIYIVAEQDVEQNTSQNPDRPDLGVCNYFEPNTPIEPPVGDTYSTITSSGVLLVGGNERTVTAVVYNSDGTINNSVALVWVITKPVGFDSYVTVNYPTNRTCKIKVLEEDTYNILGESVVISVGDGTGEYVGTLSLTIEI